ncbi:hypothetical protein BC828DRAFT_409100 [Blastocladiella britannica]|nr:hypothetical protein BC828DRAFT_409100 [Blastocladiella britannica]
MTTLVATILATADEVESDPCPICLEPPFPDRARVALLPCGHAFCRPCIDDWCAHHSAASCPPSSSTPCPLCKRSISAGVVSTCSSRSFGIALPPSPWRIPPPLPPNSSVVHRPPRRQRPRPTMIIRDGTVVNSTNPVDDPVLTDLDPGTRAILAVARRHLVYYTSAVPSFMPLIPPPQPWPTWARDTRRRAAVEVFAARDIDAAYCACVLGYPLLPSTSPSSFRMLIPSEADPVLVQWAAGVVASLAAAAATNPMVPPDELVAFLGGKVDLVTRVVDEARRFGESRLGSNAYDVLVGYDGVPSLATMARQWAREDDRQ